MNSQTPGKLLPGLLSITFRSLSASRIVELAVEAKLSAIEWGGDIHVPHGDLPTAASTRRMCENAGIAISAYGSYLRPGAPDQPSPQSVLDTAAELGTNTVRVWAGARGSANSPGADRAVVVDQLTKLCDSATARNLTIATEFHAGTLTDDIESALKLIAEVNRPNFRTFWQPPHGLDFQSTLAGLRRVKPYLAHLHIFHWYPDHYHRRPLSDGADRWPAYLREAAHQSAIDGELRYASLEFVKDDSIEQFHRDAQTLHLWLRIA